MGGIESAPPEIYDGGMAFPGFRRYHGVDVTEAGMTKRELYAVIIAAGLSSTVDHDEAADYAVKRANALLQRLRKP